LFAFVILKCVRPVRFAVLGSFIHFGKQEHIFKRKSQEISYYVNLFLDNQKPIKASYTFFPHQMWLLYFVEKAKMTQNRTNPIKLPLLLRYLFSCQAAAY